MPNSSQDAHNVDMFNVILHVSVVFNLWTRSELLRFKMRGMPIKVVDRCSGYRNWFGWFIIQYIIIQHKFNPARWSSG